MGHGVAGGLGKTLLVAGIVCALAAWPVHASAGTPGLLGLALAAAVALVGALLGRLAAFLVPQNTPEAPVHTTMVAFGLRLFVTAGLAFAVIALAPVPTMPFVLVLGVLYLALLVVEVHAAVKQIHETYAGSAGPTGAEPR